MRRSIGALAALLTMAMAIPAGATNHSLDVSVVGTIEGAGAEISTFDSFSRKLFVTTSDGIDVYRVYDDGRVKSKGHIDVGGAVNSVDTHDGLVAVAVEASTTTDPGTVVFVRALTDRVIGSVVVGSLPDMVTFTPDGNRVVVANEGEPNDDYTIDPEGSVSVIEIHGWGPVSIDTTVATADFNDFDSQLASLVASGIRIFGPGASVSQDLEPEYVAVSADSATAYVTLQENNALAVVDLESAQVTSLIPLGYKDYSLEENAIDASNDDGIDGNFQTYENVVGMYQPDAIAQYGGYLFTANEGDARDYDGYSEEERVSDEGNPNPDYLLDGVFDPAVLDEAVLGRLKTTTAKGDIDDDGDFDVIHSYGARSMSVWDTNGNLVYDTGNLTEKAVLANGTWNDGRSDDKGSEPEGVTVGSVDGVPYVFLGLERTSDIVIFDASDPTQPEILQLITAPDGVVSPEGLEFVSAENSPTGKALLIVTYEVSATVVVFELG